MQAFESTAQMAYRMKLKALEMALGAGKNGSHLGPAFSCMEIMATLYNGVLNIDCNNPHSPNRDRFISSKAHFVLAYYTALYEKGFLSEENLSTFEKNGTFLIGHPIMDVSRGIEYSGGSLGMALSVGVGIALALKSQNNSARSFVLLGDGELDEGSNWEAIMSASHFKLDNLIVIVDKNQLQYDGNTEDIMALGDLSAKFQAFGWHTNEINGHNLEALFVAFSKIGEIKNKPYVIIANTIKGHGISFMENVREWHHGVLSQTQYEQAISEIRREP